MSNHVHIGFMSGLTTFLFVVIFGFFWRLIAGRLAEQPVGKAMSFIY